MIVLALETATRDGSVALARDGAVIAHARGDGSRPHAARLPGDALALLGPAGLTLGDVDVFAVCLGPGAFTGLRVGIASAQGLAFATARPIVGVSALDALGVAALEGRELSAVAGVWMDAARGEVFAARYVLAPDDAVWRADRLGEAGLGAAAATSPRRWADDGPPVSHWIGDGVVRYREADRPRDVARANAAAGAAGGATWHARRRRRARGRAARAAPIYVRPADVELAREKKARR